MNTFVGGSTVGTQYSQLQVSGTAALAGTLSVTLASGFTPALNSTFTVLTAGSVTKTFSNSTIAINSSEHFVVSYTSTSVVLTVVSGAAPGSGGQPQAALAAGLPLRRQLLPIRSGNYKVGVPPRNTARFLVAGSQTSQRRTGVIVAGMPGYGSTLRLPVQSLNPWQPKTPLVTRATPLNLASVPRSMTQVNNWSGERTVSTPRIPVTAMPIKRMPVRVLPPMLPRMAR
jgi:hypothetical protein